MEKSGLSINSSKNVFSHELAFTEQCDQVCHEAENVQLVQQNVSHQYIRLYVLLPSPPPCFAEILFLLVPLKKN